MKEPIDLGLYKQIFEHSMDAIMLTSPDGRIHRVNKAACALFQLSEKEIVENGRKAIMDLSDPRIGPALDERAKVGRVKTEINMIKKGGIVFPVELTSVIFKEDEQQWTVTIIRDLTEIKQLQEIKNRQAEHTAYLATHDYLTDIYNRYGFIQKLKKLIADAKRKKQRLSLILLDIDGFKKINDHYGHLKGDTYLVKFTKRMRQYLKDDMIFGRYGGDEFIIALPGYDEPSACLFAKSLNHHMTSYRAYDKEKKVQVDCSMGVASLNGHCHSVDAFISCADDRMYEEKSRKYQTV